MADVLTEFVNDPSVSYSELVAGYPIVTNTASEQAVVKEVQLINPNSRTLTLSVGDTVINTTSNSTKLVGSEIIGASNALNLKTTTTAILNKVIQFPSTTTQRLHTFTSTLFAQDPFSTTINNTSSVDTTISPTASSNIYFAVIANNGDFYYSGNASGSLYRRAGGINGTQTTITTNGAACSYDGRYIYSFQVSGQIVQVTDTQNNGSTVSRNVTGPFGPLPPITSDYSHSSALDGYVWVHPSYTTVSYLINGATGAGVQIGGIDDGSAQRFFVGLGKNNNGDYIGVQAATSGTGLLYWNFGPSLASAFVKASGTITGAISFAGPNTFSRSFENLNYLFVFQNTTSVIDLTGLRRSTFLSGASVGSTMSITAPTITTLDSTKANTDFGSVGVRATGVKTTA